MAEQTTETVASETTSQETQTQGTQTTQAANTTESAPVEQTATEQTAEQAPEAKPLGDKGVEELVTQRRKRQEAERDAAYWRGIAEASRVQGTQQAAPVKPVPQGPPTIEQFENYDDYQRAMARYEVRQEMAQENQRAARTQIETGWEAKLAKARDKYPDIDEAVNKIGYTVSEPMALIIKASDKGPEIVQHLAMNPGEASRIARLNPIMAAHELGRIEAQLAAPTKTNRISQAPEPIRNLNPNAKVGDFNYETSSMDDYMKRRNTEAKG